MTPMDMPTTPRELRNARLPRWCLPTDWPMVKGQPASADVSVVDGLITAVVPTRPPAGEPGAWSLGGVPVLPGFVDAHTHLDKAFTLARMGTVEPGLLGAIEAMHVDRQSWTQQDVHARAAKAMQWAFKAGVVRLRTHCDWWEPDSVPVAWPVLGALADEWAGRIALDRVALIPLGLFATRDQARAMARHVAGSGPGARLGGFVHSTNWDAQALVNLLQSADDFGLDIDLHIDEELNPAACGLQHLAQRLSELRFSGRVVCGHACALAAQPLDQALATLDAVARAPITLVALPITNLLLQDATTGRTPRQRGLTLVKEARARGIPVMIASDNVQDPFCPVGSFDPLEALAAGVLAGQLATPFDDWTDSVCRADWLEREPAGLPLQVGSVADLVIFSAAEAHGFPSRTAERIVLRGGKIVAGVHPPGSAA